VIIDCNDCTMQHTAQCEDCVVTYILKGPGETVVVDGDEVRALDELGRAGLVPLLRLVPKPPPDRLADAG
jgi:hypothetical protein